MKKRRYYKSDYERLKNRRLAVLRKYKNKEYVPPEQTVIDVLTLFLPVLEADIEEEAWSICYGEDDDQEAKQIVKRMTLDIRTFMNRYGGQLKKIADCDKMVEHDRMIKTMDKDLEQLFSGCAGTQRKGDIT